MIKEKLHIVKIGGQIISDEIQLQQMLCVFNQIEGLKILVHGGGRTASELEAALGLETKKIDGRRITDAHSLKVVVMSYAGYTNKTIVASLQAMNCNVLGLCGADLNVIKSHMRRKVPIDFGFVGDIDEVNTDVLSGLMSLSIVPIICAITHDKKGQLLNTNADTIASQLAIALSSFYDVRLSYCFEYDGVLKNVSNPEDVIAEINASVLEELKTQGVIQSGMLPKIDNALKAKSQAVPEVCICGVNNLLTGENLTWIK